MRKSSAVVVSLENGIATGAFAAVALVMVSEIIARSIFKSGVPSSPQVVAHLVLIGGLFSGVVATRRGEHLSIALTSYLKNERIKALCSVIAASIAAFALTIFAWGALSFVKIGLDPWTMVWFVPDQILALVMPFGYAVMAYLFARSVAKSSGHASLAVAVVAAGTFFAIPMIVKVIWGFDVPESIYPWTDRINAFLASVAVPAAVLLLCTAFIGTPLFVVLGGAAALLIQAGGGEVDVVANQAYTLFTQGSLPAIPLFSIVGFFLSESKAGERLVAAFKALFGWLPGGIIIATVFVCAFFTSFTGASGVTILALGGILYGILVDRMHYPERFVIGLLTAVGSLGLLFPPSLPLILVGASTQTNIIHMFAGGLIPGLFLVVSMGIFGVGVSIKHKTPVEPFSLRGALGAIRGAFWEIALPVLLVAGYFSGLLSVVEIGAAAVVYVVVVEIFINRDLTLRDIPKVFSKAMPIVGGILSILAMSQAFSYYMVDAQAPDRLATWLHAAVSSRFVFLMMLNLALLVVGCLMDIFSAILVVLPLIAPLGVVYGINPVHLGVIFIINMEFGFLTPPVGMNLFLSSYRFEKPFLEIARSVLPFLGLQLCVVLAVTYLPWMTEVLLPLFK